MNETPHIGRNTTRGQSPVTPEDTPSAQASLRSQTDELVALFSTSFDHSERVEAICTRLKQSLAGSGTEISGDIGLELAQLLRQRGGPMAKSVFDLLASIIVENPDPWPLLSGVLDAANADLVDRSVELVLRLARSGSLPMDRRIVSTLADRLESDDSLVGRKTCLQAVFEILGQMSSGGSQSRDDLLRDLYVAGKTAAQRSLAARLLDLDGRPVPGELARVLVGADNLRILAPYLAYTRATHLDLLHLASAPNLTVTTVPSLCRARAICGEGLLRKIIAELGWARVNLGLEVRRYLGCSVNGSLPLLVTPSQASLISACDNVRSVRESLLFVAHGGLPHLSPTRKDGDDPVARFRATNMAHAELLALILDMAPLTREKVQDILRRVDRIVDDFTMLFSSYTEECAILPELYRELRGRVIAELEHEANHPQLSPELSRLVQMFEDPRTLGEVRTLHGLKRYLHQRGLKLGFQLVGRALATNRTVDLVLASRRQPLATVKRIRYADFESDTDGGNASNDIPFPVSVIVDGFARQLLYGQESFPQVDTYCYGNEVHYYLSFGNHPAFLRIDYSPPLRGGMIDLEYYGVSKYELSGHPDISLNAIGLFFRRLEFEVNVNNTHVRVRYDKERSLNLGDVCRRADAIFRLAPYMMDIDWIIGSLNLDSDARRVVAEAWSESFVRWGVLPLRDLLTDDRTGIRTVPQAPASADTVLVWPGRGPYADRFSVPLAEGFHAGILARLEKVGLDFLWPLELGESRVIGQMDLERLFLGPLREAVARGEVVETANGFQAQPIEFFRREHESERFAEILGSRDEIAGAAQLAELVTPLERSLRFHTTGSINGYEVQRGRLALRGESITIYVLRDALGVIRLALFAKDRTLYLRRYATGEDWRSNASYNSTELATLLLRNNYLAAGTELVAKFGEAEGRAIVACFRRLNPARRRRGLPGERIIDGLRASPGRTVGRVVLGTTGRTPDDCAGAVLVAATVGPQDNPLLYRCAGIVSTGGGILSHAGLIAAQFRKPALIIQGQWQMSPDGPISLLYRMTEHSEEEKLIDGYRVASYRHLHEREHPLTDGDLVVLNANDGTLGILGHDRETLALHEGIRRFGEATRPLEQARDAKEILTLRGRLLQARHQIERLIDRLRDPALAHYVLYELLLGEDLSGCGGDSGERPRLLRQLLANPHIGTAVRDQLLQIDGDLSAQALTACDKAVSSIPTADTLYEVLLRRLQALRLIRTCENVRTSLNVCGIDASHDGTYDVTAIDQAAWQRLAALRDRHLQSAMSATFESANLRHVVRQLERINLALGSSNGDDDAWRKRRMHLAHEDRQKQRGVHRHLTLTAADGGLELAPFIGLKAANLAEIERLGGRGMVPAWFVVSDHAFRETMRAPLGQSLKGVGAGLPPAPTLRDAIEAVLKSPDDDFEEKSRQIQNYWRTVGLSEPLKKEILAAYGRLSVADPAAEHLGTDPSSPFVAIRSSTREEDAEAAARAGEFDTYLFIRGSQAILEYVRLAWGGLWTARAIQNRALFDVGPTETGGGVIVQRMVRSRVSGVLHTVNMVSGEPGEIVINAGLGLGEGIVSGAVPADHIVVAKEGVLEGLPLRFRYTTADKREQVVFDTRTGFGTQRVETLYHQRFRASLEYVELCELVRAAVQLEAVYGYPLDIEFGIEGTKLWILQARPVPTYMTVLQETLEHWPLDSPASLTSTGRTAEIGR